MITATVRLRGASPYGQGKWYSVPRLEGEADHDYELRTWRNRLHWDTDGKVYIPGQAFKRMLDNAAKRRGDKIKGKGQKTFAKIFESGIMVIDNASLGIDKDKVGHIDLNLPSRGERDGGKRVPKRMPMISEWEGELRFYILDAQITEDVFTKTLDTASKFIGLGFFRPERGGYWGRFEVVSIIWEDDREAMPTAAEEEDQEDVA